MSDLAEKAQILSDLLSQVDAISVDENNEKNSKKQDKNNADRPNQQMKAGV
jgi:hypothetical protein